MCNRGCSGLLVFLDINNDSVLRGLKVPCHWFDKDSIVIRSSFSLTAASFGLLTKTYRLVSSAKRRALDVRLLTIALM